MPISMQFKSNLLEEKELF